MSRDSMRRKDKRNTYAFVDIESKNGSKREFCIKKELQRSSFKGEGMKKILSTTKCFTI